MNNLSQKWEIKLRNLINLYQLDEITNEILSHSKECLAMIAETKEDYRLIGNTRFGGDPDLPTTIPWPRYGKEKNSPCSNFIAQINFSEFPIINSDIEIPASGILYIFVNYMECAGDPVEIHAEFYDGDLSRLKRTRCPDKNNFAVEYWISDLKPYKIIAKTTVSIARYKKDLQNIISKNSAIIDGKDGNYRLNEIEENLQVNDQIGQLFGFANSHTDNDNLCRQMVLGYLGQRYYMYSDYFNTIDEFEKRVNQSREEKNEQMIHHYEKMREGVMWLDKNKDLLLKTENEWLHLFKINSNSKMQLHMMDNDPLYIFIQIEKLLKKDFSLLLGEVTQG